MASSSSNLQVMSRDLLGRAAVKEINLIIKVLRWTDGSNWTTCRNALSQVSELIWRDPSSLELLKLADGEHVLLADCWP